MKLIQKIRLLKRDHYLSLVDNRYVWSQGEEFSEMVKKELNRSRRNGLPISSVVFDFSTDETFKTSDWRYRCFFKELITFLTENTRYNDIKYVCNPYKIGILLVDTDLEGAKAFVGKISRILYQNDKYLGIHVYRQLIESTKVTISPLGEVEDSVTVTTSLDTAKDSIFDSEATDDVPFVVRERDETVLRWEEESSSRSDLIQNIDGITNSHCNGTCILCYRTFKRLIDIIGSAVGIVLFSPLMVIITIAIKATSKGSILYKQKRVGYLGESFTFLKFRTMKSNGNDQAHREYVKKLVKGKSDEVNRGTKDEPLYKLDNDSRVTRVGWVLRKTSLDELPQFFNVLIGNMSLVGPRPAIFYEAEDYKNWHWLRVMETKPGITGIWQVSGRSRTTFDEMVRLDLQYIKKQSTLLDLEILLKTFGAVLNTKGAL
jgi:lipopolysaccharide/colanic/teichoic acid biosynthesis glycosyltransferase